MLKHSHWMIGAALLVSLGWAGMAMSQATDAEATTDVIEAVPTVATATVTSGPLTVVREFDGVFVAGEMAPVEIDPEVFSDLEVVEAVAVGTVVRQGDVILRFNADLYAEQLAEMQLNQQIADIEFARTAEQFRFRMAAFDRDLEWARRAGRIAQEDFARWLEVTEGYREQYLALEAEGIALGREMAAEELRQLRQMYEADELIEDTETIILRRNEYYDARSQVDHQVNLRQYDYRIEQDIPREREQMNRDLEDANIALERAETFTPMDREVAELRFQQAQRAQTDATDRLADMVADEQWLVIEAPADGVVYYGQCLSGQWQSGSLEEQLAEGGRVAPGQTVMTIVSPDVAVRAPFGESNLFELDLGDAVYVRPTGYPRLRLTGTVSDLAVAPSLNQRYVLHAALDESDARIQAGMTCRVTVVVADAPETLWLDAAAVFTDEATGERFVYLADDGATRRVVEVGYEQDGQLEILSGLADGDEVLLDAPEQD